MDDRNDTIFGKILRGEIPSERVWEDDHCIAFKDIQATAPIHLLIIPRKHIPTLNDISPEEKELAGHLLYVAGQIAKQEGIAEEGYRLVINCNKRGGQLVFHLHIHLIGGRDLQWPPG